MPQKTKKSSRTKQDKILTLARKHPKLESLLKGGNKPVSVQPNITDRGQPDGAKQTVLSFYDHERHRSVVVLVDPKRDKVLSVAETSAQFQLSEEEQTEAEGLAAKDTRVRAFLGRRRMNPLTRLYFPRQKAGEGALPHRYAIVFLRPNNSERRYAVVDLSERKVVDVLAPNALTTV
jgi:hypothetical protein